MKKASFIFTIVLLPITFFGTEHILPGARSAALSNASVTLQDTWSTLHNQAGLGFVRNITSGIYYENRFLLKELSTRGAAVAIPLKTGTFGFSVNAFGYSLYRENKYNLSFAKAFSNMFSIGMALDYLHTQLSEGNENYSAIVGEAGILIKIHKDLLLGAHLYNPTRSRLGKNTTERIPTVMRLGINYSFSSRVMFVLETEKDLSQKPRFKAGIEYQPLPHFYLRAGISNNPILSTFGTGLQLRNFQIDLSATYHQALGVTPQLGLTYLVVKKEKTDRDDP